MNVKNLLITGFDPFGGAGMNPSWEAVRCLPDKIGEWQLTKIEVPTVFDVAAKTVINVASDLQPEVILCIGQAGGRNSITPEVYGVNLRHARIADNAGNRPLAQPIVRGAQAAYATTLPVHDMVRAVRAVGLPSKLSYSAGRFVCNDLLFTLLYEYSGTNTKVGFIHVPYMPEQAEPCQPSMTIDAVVKAISAAVSAI